jgi:hypothetical protein
LHKHQALVCALALILSACGGSSNDVEDTLNLRDADAAANQIAENAPTGSVVGVTVAAQVSGSAGTLSYSLTDDAGGAFAIDATTGIVRRSGAIDYETATERPITAQALLTNGSRQSRGTRTFRIAILDSPTPTLELTFPFAHARHSDSIIAASGRVTHPQLQTVQITASAGGATVAGTITGERFTIRDIPVSGGADFTLTVTASHAGGDSVSRQMTLSREPELTDVRSMVLDPTRNRVLFADLESGSVIAAPLDGGARVLVSGRHVGFGPALRHPTAITINPQGDAIFVADDVLGAIFNISVATGNRSQLGSGEPRLFDPNELDFDTVRGNLLLSDEQAGVLAIDVATGVRRVVSSGQSPGPQIYYHRGVGFDAARDRILVNDSSSLFAVNPLTGVRTMISNWLDDPATRFLEGMSVASSGGVVYLGDEFGNGVVRIDLLTGSRETVTSSGMTLFNYPAVGAGQELQYPEDVVFDAASNRLFLVEGEFADPLIEVRPNGDRVLIRNASLGSGVNFRSPAGIKYDAARHVLMAADYIGDVVAEIDPTTGHRTVISGRSDGRGSIDTDTMDVAFAPESGEHYIVDFQTKTLYAVAAGGATRVVTSPTTGSGPPLLGPRRVEVDEARHIAYVFDEQAVIAVNLEDGARQTILSGIGSPAGMALDLPSRRLFVSNLLGPIFEIDLATGAHRTVSGGGAFGVGGGLAYDNVNARLLSMDQASFRLESIDVISGVRTELMGAGIWPVRPHSIAVDAERQIAYITEDAYDAIIAIDLQSGYRQLIAK